MRRLSGVSFVLLSMLGLSFSGLSGQVGSQGSAGQKASGFQFEPNYPNPFNPETTIPFVLNEDLFGSGRPVVVSMRIYNLLRQPLAAPTALRHPAGEGVPLLNLEYSSPGRYQAFWDGRDSSGRQVASGVYWVQLTVNGVSKNMKMFVAK